MSFIAQSLILACVLVLGAQAQQHYEVYYNGATDSFYTTPPFPPHLSSAQQQQHGPRNPTQDTLVCTGFLGNESSVTGWYRFGVEGAAGVSDVLMMRGAGYLEGLLTSPLIDDAIANYAMDTSNKTLMNLLEKWFTTWGGWMRDQAKAHPDDPYWVHVGLILEQLSGVTIGHNAACVSPCTPLRDIDILLLSPSVMDIITVISGQSPDWASMTEAQAQLESARRTHCSALIKRTSDGDVYLGHTTWNMYTGMVRLFKTYSLPLAASQTNAITITFSSYPGALYSGDDFIMMPETGLVVSETTNDIFNNSLYNLLQPTGTVLTWVRSMVASRMATTAPEWTELFARYNSGTYNNQYMVVDYHLVAGAMGKDLPADTLWIVEQVPGYTHAGDVTSFLNRQDASFWPSYNIPYFQDVFDISGYPDMAKTSAQYSYSQCARAQIFARDAPAVRGLADMQRLMQANDYQHDPLSLGNPGNAISSRFDLSTGDEQFIVGGIDTKIVSLRLLSQNRCYAISGPTHQSLPPFSWTGQWATFPHQGQAQTFAFNYTLISF